MLTHHPLLSSRKTLTQVFGPANWNAIYSEHNGVDFGGSFDVFSARAGKVTFAGRDTIADPKWKGGYGNYVVMDHGSGISTLYAHLQSIHVRVGEKVKGGHFLGPSDTTGYATGPHLHFGLKLNGIWIDPQPHLDNLIGIETPTALGKTAIVKIDVNMRDKAGLTSNVLGTLYTGTIVTVLSGPVDADGYSWITVQPPPVQVALKTKNGVPFVEVQ